MKKWKRTSLQIQAVELMSSRFEVFPSYTYININFLHCMTSMDSEVLNSQLAS